MRNPGRAFQPASQPASTMIESGLSHCLSADFLPSALPNPREVSDNETIDAVQFGNNGRSMPIMADVDAASAAP